MWDLLLTGRYTIPRIEEIATKQWGLKSKSGKQISLSRLYSTFRNSFYYGEFSYNDESYQGKHTPMITVEEFDRAQTILGSKGKVRPKTKRLPFTGVIECGSMITTESRYKLVKNTGESKRYMYHRCTRKRKQNYRCKQKAIKYEDLLEQVSKILDSITIPEDFLNWALSVLKEENKLEEHNKNLILVNLNKSLERNVSSIGNLITLFTSPENSDKSLLSIDEYKSQKESLMKEKISLEGQIKKHSESVDEWVELTEKTFHFATYAKCHFEEGDFEKKTEILSCLGRNLKLKDQKLALELEKPYVSIKEGMEKWQL